MSSDFESVFAKIANDAKNKQAQVELFIERSEQTKISFQQRVMHKFASSQNQCAGIRVISDSVTGYSFTENLSEDALLEAYGLAVGNVHFKSMGGRPKVPGRLLDSNLNVPEMKELANDSIKAVPMETKIDRARILESAALDTDPRIQSAPHTTYSESDLEIEILSSTGLRRKQRTTAVFGYTYSIAREGAESVQGIDEGFTRNAAQFDAKKIAERSAKRALEKLGSGIPETGIYSAVIDRDAMQNFLAAVAPYFSAKAVLEKNSIFSNDLNIKIGADCLTIEDDPFYKGGVGSRAFDGEGSACRKTILVENGRLVNFLTNSEYAHAMNLPLTSNAARSARSELDIDISNLAVKPGIASFESLLGAEKKMILITDFHGFHSGFRSATGDFSMQAEGELWENGRRVRCLKDFVVSGNVRGFFNSVEALSNRMSEMTSTVVVTPDFLVRGLSIAGRKV